MFEEEVFEITDFTTASEWERFISQFEEILRQWDLNAKPTQSCLPKGAYVNGKWNEKQDSLKFGKGNVFNVYYYFLEQKESLKIIKSVEPDTDSNPLTSTTLNDLMSRENDFPGKAHSLVRWYGLRELVIISPANNTPVITSEDKLKLLISSACIALNNINSSIAVFVQISQRERKYYHGVSDCNGFRTYFDMIHFHNLPSPRFRFLSELLNLYEEKLNSPKDEPIMVSIRFTHGLNEWPHEWQHYKNLNSSDSYGDVIDVESFKQLPFYCSKEPISQIQLATTWPYLSEEVVVDSPVHSDLDPMQAPLWNVRAVFNRDASLCALSTSIASFLSLKKSWASNQQILGKLINNVDISDAEAEIKNALNKLANPYPINSINLGLPQFNKIKWSHEELKELCINYIFKSTIEGTNSDDLRTLKTAPVDTLTWKIALTIFIIYAKFREIGDVAHLWKEILCELRTYWESAILLPDLAPASPDLGSCLFHQKLQMLNCCIEQKRLWEERQRTKSTNNKIEKAEEGSDDEFYDCEEELPDDPNAMVEPEGRLSRFEDLYLLKNTKEPLYIPVTQDPAPMTEDMLQEQTRIFSQLGSTSEGSALRVKMQTASLLSDMQAFKAANPGAVIEDFIRWHSPKDWIEDDNKKGGKLSARMQTTGNLWQEVWSSAKPIAARRQKRLFDFTKDAEKILHYLSSITLSDLVDLVFPVIMKSAIQQVLQKRHILNLNEDELPFSKDNVIMNTNANLFETAVNMIGDNELKLHQLESLQMKLYLAHELEIGTEKQKNFEELKRFALRLVSEAEVELDKASSGYFGKLVRRMFEESQIATYEFNTSVGERDIESEALSKLPYPIGKEFILRTKRPRPSGYSRASPQRMHCVLAQGEFRLAGAFTEDTTYM